jgi:preprotein translocase subunit YajC
VIFGFFYVAMIRPQSKQRKEFQQMISQLKKGDKILTSAGMYGTVKRIEDDILVIEIAKGVTIKIPRRAVSEIIRDPQKARMISTSEPAPRRGKGRKSAEIEPVEEQEYEEDQTDIEEENLSDADTVEDASYDEAEETTEDVEEPVDDESDTQRR